MWPMMDQGWPFTIQGLAPPIAAGHDLGKQRHVFSAYVRPRHGPGILVGFAPSFQLKRFIREERNTELARAALSPNGTSNPRPSASTSSAYR